MFIESIQVHFRRQFKVGYEATAWSDILQTVQNFGSVGAGFLLHKDIIHLLLLVVVYVSLSLSSCVTYPCSVRKVVAKFPIHIGKI